MSIRRMFNFRNRRLLVAAVAAVIAFAATSRAEDQRANWNTAAKGVVHQIYASVTFHSTSKITIADAPLGPANLSVLIRISDHSRESNFFGTVEATFTGISIGNEIPNQQKIWVDQSCHQDRGLPWIMVTEVNGVVDKATISARPRRIGKLTPVDEIVRWQSLIPGNDENGRYMLYRAVTQMSHIEINVKVFVTRCNL